RPPPAAPPCVPAVVDLAEGPRMTTEIVAPRPDGPPSPAGAPEPGAAPYARSRPRSGAALTGRVRAGIPGFRAAPPSWPRAGPPRPAPRRPERRRTTDPACGPGPLSRSASGTEFRCSARHRPLEWPHVPHRPADRAAPPPRAPRPPRTPRPRPPPGPLGPRLGRPRGHLAARHHRPGLPALEHAPGAGHGPCRRPGRPAGAGPAGRGRLHGVVPRHGRRRRHD